MDAVYVSSHRPKRYHAGPACNGLNSTELAGDRIISIAHREALSKGLTACGTCHPKPALAVVSSQNYPLL